MKKLLLSTLIFTSFLFAQSDSTVLDNSTSDTEKPTQTVDYQKNIAILTIKHSGGINKGEAELITDRLNAEMFKTGKVNMVERQEMSQILKEQGFQQSGACSEDACLVEMGQVLGVQEIVSGSAGRLGSLVIINLRSIDVATGKIKMVVSRDIDGELQDVIKHLPNIAREIVGLPLLEIKEEKKAVKKTDEIPKKQLKPTKNAGMLVIKTIPDNADIYLNGNKVGTTPFASNTLLPGKYKLEIKKDKFETYTEEFELNAGSVKQVGRNLTYKYSIITILTKPEGATITLDGKIIGKTPFYNDTLTPDEYKLKLFLKNHKPVEDKYLAIKNISDTLAYKLFTEKFIDNEKKRQREEKKGRRIARRIIFGTLAAGAWGTGIYYNSEVKKSINNENDLYEKYMEVPTSEPISAEEYSSRYSAYKKAVDSTDENRLIRNILYGTGGLFSLFFAISIPF